MSNNDIKLLEKLLEEFQSHIGHKYCIAYPVIQDGFCIGIYGNDGNLLRQESSYDLLSVADKIKTPAEPKDKTTQL